MADEDVTALIEAQAAQIEALTASNEAKDATIAEQGERLSATESKVEAIEMSMLDQELAGLTPVELPSKVAAQHWVAKTAGLGVYVVSDTPPTDAEVSYSDGLIGYVCYPQGLKDLAGNDVTVVRQGLEDSAQMVVVPTADLAFTGKTRSWEYIEDGADVTAIIIESN